MLARGGRRRSALLGARLFYAKLNLLGSIDQTILGLPHLMLGGGLKGVEVLFGLLKIQSVLLGIAKVDLSDGLDSAWVTLVTVPGY